VNPNSRTDTAPTKSQITSTAVESIPIEKRPNVIASAARP
jgi:hypothetical protein